MSSRAFVDTNIFIYLYSEDEAQKQEIAQKAINKYERMISTQVLNEFSNICIGVLRSKRDKLLVPCKP
jgi:predicted nucleic acid-binding protein